MKICKKCKQEKEENDFYTSRNCCKECIINTNKEYKRKYQPKTVSRIQSRKYALKSKYNLSTAEYQKLYSEQGARCVICRIPESELKKNLCVDHDHKTGKIRGLLCVLCNQGLGSFRDNQSNLENALYYLILHK